MKVLLADDHALFRHGVRLALQELYQPVTVIEAGTVGEALKALQSENGFDVVLFDLDMPDAQGFVSLSTAVQAAGETPIVVISASESLTDIRGAINAGARGYILKSSTVEALRHGLPLVLCGETYIPLPGAVLARLEHDMTMHPPGHRHDHHFADAPGQDGSGRSGMEVGQHHFTPRQVEVAKLLVQGLSNKEIARRLGVIDGTVKVHVREVLRKLGARNRTHAAIVATQHHLFSS